MQPVFLPTAHAEEIPQETEEQPVPEEGEPAPEGGESAEPPAADPYGNLFSPPFEPAATAVYMVNRDTGMTVYEKNADTQVTAASLVKLITAMLVIENIEDLDGTLISSDKGWVYDELYGKNASHADIRKGETLSVRELLYGLMLPSGNEAALLLADHVGGGNIDNFLFLMNSRVESLGCTGTHFVDPNGLSEGNLTTARDMALIMEAFIGYDLLLEIAATPIYEMAAHEKHEAPYLIQNTNKLIDPTSPYYTIYRDTAGLVQAGKTGSLGEWQNFVSYAASEDQSYILAVMNSPNESDVFGAEQAGGQQRPALTETAALYNWAFTGLNVRPVLDTSQPITEVPVRYSTENDSLKLYPTSDLRTVLRVEDDDSRITKEFNVPEFVAAPITEGEPVGSITLSIDGTVIGTAELRAGSDIKRNPTLFAVRKAQEFFKSTYFRVVIILIVVGICLYIAGTAFMMYLQLKRKQNPDDKQ